ncbi:hypothetical protein GCM10011349_24090 [Novosphingobium indicum]|uniref:HNH endonuclease n=1 Tax=Novosphingobium indicum TaxID=462949 RepID=A0ABQ2JRU2_9SPHN|nr:hypothetical protein [Novosphingobium indicum]GGN51511.1 hypothetical protein GCM10011349_24090 [Novosphingobium indicum]
MTERRPHPWEYHYNGWSWAERCAVTPIQNALFRSGQLVRPTACTICGFSDPARLDGRGYIFAHLERYDRPTELYPACKRCHAALHARFRDPGRWQLHLCRFALPASWGFALTLDPASQWEPFELTYPLGLPVPMQPPALKPLQEALPFPERG